MKDIEALKAFSSQLKKGMGLTEDLAEFDEADERAREEEEAERDDEVVGTFGVSCQANSVDSDDNDYLFVSIALDTTELELKPNSFQLDKITEALMDYVRIDWPRKDTDKVEYSENETPMGCSYKWALNEPIGYDRLTLIWSKGKDRAQRVFGKPAMSNGNSTMEFATFTILRGHVKTAIYL
jgi:hypothetical protein